MFEQNLIRSTANAAEDQFYSTGSDSHILNLVQILLYLIQTVFFCLEPFWI